MKLITPQTGLYQGLRTGAPSFFIGGSYCAEARNFFARCLADPSFELKKLINKTIRDYKDSGIWDESDIIYRFNLHTEQASLLNLKESRYNCLNVNGLSFTPKVGFIGASGKYLNTQFNPKTNGMNWKVNRACIAYKNANANVANGASFGCWDAGGGPEISCFPRYGNVYYAAMNSTEFSFNNVLSGNYYQQKNGINYQVYIERVLKKTIDGAFNNIPNRTMFLLALNQGTPVYYATGETAISFKMGGMFNYSANKDIEDYFDANIGGTF